MGGDAAVPLGGAVGFGDAGGVPDDSRGKGVYNTINTATVVVSPRGKPWCVRVCFAEIIRNKKHKNTHTHKKDCCCDIDVKKKTRTGTKKAKTTKIKNKFFFSFFFFQETQ